MPQAKQGLFKRIFGRGKRGGEHESFSGFAQYAPPERVPEDAGQNIVILNSLTHDQLMELLKASQSYRCANTSAVRTTFANDLCDIGPCQSLHL